ncbi:hypothetical protein JD844_016791 [Phrynosoma platyrhinos]|uniref:Serpin domain-containing protein n=1 Tax=Phrynosoma platyrhinos TaxID=52577 RepID=A0ABQ7SKY7_PHRPL|nr:hypothetical protein JD844_016791 [Phrynosoma platyrhinos]
MEKCLCKVVLDTSSYKCLKGQIDFTMASLAEENAKLALDFLHLLSKEHPHENIVFSPVNLSAALSLLRYGSQSQAIRNKATYRDSSLFTTSGESERQTTDGSLVLLAAETIPQADVEEGVSLHYIPWRKHLIGMEESENLIQEKSSPVEKVSRNQDTAHKNAHKSLIGASPPMSSSQAKEAKEDMSTLLYEFRHTVKCADDNAQAFKESWVLFKECCDNMCTSMSNLQGALETLITILRE